MLTETLRSIFERDLQKLHSEISLYRNEQNLWKIDKDILNPAGNLCLHLIGNLNTYIGKELGNTGYVRNREEEFSLKDVPRHILLEKLTDTKSVVSHTISTLNDEALQKTYPSIVFEKSTTTEFMLIHLTAHLNYHLGQINYHRRLLDTA